MDRGVVLSLEFAVMCDACQNMERVWLNPFCVVEKGVTVTSFLSGSFIWTRPASPWNSFIVIPEISMWLNGYTLSRYACISCYDQKKCSGKRLPKSDGLLCSAFFFLLFFFFFFCPLVDMPCRKTKHCWREWIRFLTVFGIHWWTVFEGLNAPVIVQY